MTEYPTPINPQTRAWAKTRDGNPSSPPTITVRCHGLETQQIAILLAPWFLRHIPEAQQQRAIFLAANHDIGKACPDFYCKSEQLWTQTLIKNKNAWEIRTKLIPHQFLSALLLQNLAESTPIEEQIVAVHHGIPSPRHPFLEVLKTLIEERFALDTLEKGSGREEPVWKSIQSVEFIKTNTQPLELDHTHASKIAGFITLCDHLASSIPHLASHDWENTQPWSTAAIEQFLTTKNAWAPLTFKPTISSFEKLLGFKSHPQQEIPWKGKGIYLIERATGSGKTETAMDLIRQAVAAGDHTGFYFGLPSRLTSNRIYTRIHAILRNASCQGVLTLNHGTAWLENNTILSLQEQSHPDALAWLAGKNHPLLASCGVGTIDQVLLATVCSKNWPLRQLCLQNKLIVIDEAHSFDAYTTTLLRYAIPTLQSLGCSVILLSATLSNPKKRELLGQDIPMLPEMGVTYKTATEIGSIKIQDEGTTPHPIVAIQRWECITLEPTDATWNKALDEAIALTSQGNKVLWITNTVEAAQRCYWATKHLVSASLLHSRFTTQDRMEKEDSALHKFQTSAGGELLIGTQVLEQSLDLDADTLFTELCPLELLIQRIGRLWRKKKENRTGIPTVHVLLPKNIPSENLTGLAKTRFVYHDHFQLCRAWKFLEKYSIMSKITPREILGFKPDPETPGEENLLRKEMEFQEKARSLALRTDTQFLPTTTTKLCYDDEPHAEDGVEYATTRLDGTPTIELIIFQNSENLWDGSTYTLKNVHKNKVTIPRNHIQGGILPLGGAPWELRLGKWIETLEISHCGIIYHKELGAIPLKTAENIGLT